ncbi:MAG: NAD-dependent epimerase/dehydratase family protein [Caldilineaceae bacterium]|nr:NAD-dependent epimerase/dehydratase family protein [Caldilineaceae bacterium]
MRYFLTGATGFVGGRVAYQLREQGHEVVAVVRTPERADALVELGVELVKGDVTDKESMREAMAGTDGVFHIAGWYKIGTRDKSAGQRINVDGTRNVLELMQELAVPKGVYTSTLAVNSHTHGRIVDESYVFHGTHLSEYDRTKAEAHKVAEAFIAQGLPLVIVMPGLIYGPGDTSTLRTTLTQYLQRRLPVIPRQTAFSWAHVDDIAWAHIAAMERGEVGEQYIIAGPTHTLAEALQIAQELTGVPAPRAVPPQLLSGMAPLMGILEKILPLPSDYTAEGLRVTGGTTYIGDNSKARRVLGYNPRPLQEGLAETLKHEMQLMGMSR